MVSVMGCGLSDSIGLHEWDFGGSAIKVSMPLNCRCVSEYNVGLMSLPGAPIKALSGVRKRNGLNEFIEIASNVTPDNDLFMIFNWRKLSLFTTISSFSIIKLYAVIL